MFHKQLRNHNAIRKPPRVALWPGSTIDCDDLGPKFAKSPEAPTFKDL